MKKRKCYRIAEKRFPKEKDREMLKLLAEGIRIGGEKNQLRKKWDFNIKKMIKNLEFSNIFYIFANDNKLHKNDVRKHTANIY